MSHITHGKKKFYGDLISMVPPILKQPPIVRKKGEKGEGEEEEEEKKGYLKVLLIRFVTNEFFD
ncbi:hypothetical protein E1A91_A05G421900v1 [Gossypium mustelinum]|uniref:Uncharacterized protein n=1 Tax=Gossypium mustelinum TaxID=34275 RepID=A0A5D2ZJ51_GOSMU|nr:hypothetical protein E1A91_A05G421900v1 [Gossypium mustelinum]